MKIIIKILLMAGIAYFTLLALPWWSLVAITFAVSVVIPSNDFGAFLSGFIGIGLLWLVLAWKIDIETDSILSQKIADLFPVGGDTTTLVIVAGFVGGISGGFGSLSGNLLRKIWMKKKSSLYH